MAHLRVRRSATAKEVLGQEEEGEGDRGQHGTKRARAGGTPREGDARLACGPCSQYAWSP